MRYLFLAFCALPCFGQTCSQVNMPAVIVQGQTFQPAIVNGVDFVSYSQMRFQWFSNAATTAINAQRIVYATAAQYAANGNVIVSGTAGTNYSIHLSGSSNVTTNNALQGGILTNLAPNVTYFIAGQSSANGGSTWCAETGTKTSFTTLAFTGVVKPIPPQTFAITVPTITHTSYVVGVAPCNSGASLWLQFVNCLANAVPGDGIGIPPGPPYITSPGPSFTLPQNPNAIPVSVSGSTFTCGSTCSGLGLTNGTQIHIGSTFYPPSPTQSGVIYSVLNSSGATFQLSLDGTNALTLNDTGIGTILITIWPNTQDYILIYSTASASSLPPDDVRQDPAYSSALGHIQLLEPFYGGTTAYQFTTSYTNWLYFKNIEFDLLPNAPPCTTAATCDMDPLYYPAFGQLGQSSDHVIFDQVYFHGPPPPDRVAQALSVGGTNIGIINSYFDNIVYQEPMRVGALSSANSSTITIQSHTFSYTNGANAEHTCTLGSAATLNTTDTSIFIYWVIPACTLTANVPTGSSASWSGGGSGVITTQATPAYPTILEPIGNVQTPSVLRIGATAGSGPATFVDSTCTGAAPNFVPPTRFGNAGCGDFGSTIQIQRAVGPIIFSNNRFGGGEIVGIFQDEFVGNACQGVTACDPSFNTINLSAQRNSLLLEPYLDFTTGAWKGSYWGQRNGPELKQGRFSKWDGNIIGPMLAGVAGGECALFVEFYGSNDPSLANNENTSDIEFSNNTCYNVPTAVNFGGTNDGVTEPNPQRSLWVHNNIFNLVNGIARNPEPHSSTGTGRGIWFDSSESGMVDHNTFYYNGSNGSQSGGPAPQFNPSGGFSIQNNILNYTTDAAGSSGWNYTGNAQIPWSPNNTQGSALLNGTSCTGTYGSPCPMQSTAFLNNVYLCQWSNSDPSSYVEITTATCNTDSALYPAGTYFPNSGSTLANRVAQISWFNPTAGDFHLNYLSPYISGAHAGSDGLDIGANIDTLNAAQGLVDNVRVYSITSSGATVAWNDEGWGYALAYGATDTVGSIDYLTTAQYVTNGNTFTPGTYTRATSGISNTGIVQNIALTGLTTATAYTFRVNGLVQQPIGAFTTH